MSIKAINTRYKGCHFRSRLEARWAVFFDYVGVKWLYEPQGFTLPSGDNYLPDFYLPDIDVWIEVKGCSIHDIDNLNYDGAIKVIDFSECTGKRIFVLGEIPDGGLLYYCMDEQFKDDAGVVHEYPRHISSPVDFSEYTFHVRDCCELIIDDFGDGFDLAIGTVVGEYLPYHGVKQEGPCKRCGAKKWRHTTPIKAFKAALSARFEHGENGVT